MQKASEKQTIRKPQMVPGYRPVLIHESTKLDVAAFSKTLDSEFFLERVTATALIKFALQRATDPACLAVIVAIANSIVAHDVSRPSGQLEDSKT